MEYVQRFSLTESMAHPSLALNQTWTLRDWISIPTPWWLQFLIGQRRSGALTDLDLSSYVRYLVIIPPIILPTAETKQPKQSCRNDKFGYNTVNMKSVQRFSLTESTALPSLASNQTWTLCDLILIPKLWSLKYQFGRLRLRSCWRKVLVSKF